MSAAEQQLEGCPLPASVVAFTLSMRRCVALLANAIRRSGVAVEAAEAVMRDPFRMGTDKFRVIDWMMVERVGPPLNGTKLTNGMQGVNEGVVVTGRPLRAQNS